MDIIYCYVEEPKGKSKMYKLIAVLDNGDHKFIKNLSADKSEAFSKATEKCLELGVALETDAPHLGELNKDVCFEGVVSTTGYIKSKEYITFLTLDNNVIMTFKTTKFRNKIGRKLKISAVVSEHTSIGGVPVTVVINPKIV